MIDQTVIMQAQTFLLSILFGWFIGAACDLWKLIWKYLWNTPLIMDAVFWALIGIGLFVFAMSRSGGAIRGYFFLGWLTGWMIYCCIFRKIFKRIYISCLDLLKKGIKTVKIFIERR